MRHVIVHVTGEGNSAGGARSGNVLNTTQSPSATATATTTTTTTTSISKSATGSAVATTSGSTETRGGSRGEGKRAGAGAGAGAGLRAKGGGLKVESSKASQEFNMEADFPTLVGNLASSCASFLSLRS